MTSTNDPVEEYVRRCVAEAPALTAAQREAISAVLKAAPAQEPEANA